MDRVKLRDVETGVTISFVAMMLDTGSDVTLVPRSAVTRLGVSVDEDKLFAVRGFDEQERRCPSARLELVFLRRRFQGTFLLINQETGILGRDILNQFCLRFDGPDLFWEQEE